MNEGAYGESSRISNWRILDSVGLYSWGRCGGSFRCLDVFDLDDGGLCIHHMGSRVLWSALKAAINGQEADPATSILCRSAQYASPKLLWHGFAIAFVGAANAGKQLDDWSYFGAAFAVLLLSPSWHCLRGADAWTVNQSVGTKRAHDCASGVPFSNYGVDRANLCSLNMAFGQKNFSRWTCGRLTVIARLLLGPSPFNVGWPREWWWEKVQTAYRGVNKA